MFQMDAENKQNYFSVRWTQTHRQFTSSDVMTFSVFVFRAALSSIEPIWKYPAATVNRRKCR